MTPEERLRAGRAQQAAAEQAGTVQELSRGRKPKTLLPSDPPAPGASREELVAWSTVALGLGGDPIDTGVRFGRHEDARMVLTLKSGRRIVFDRQADAFDAPTLRRRVIIATGASIPHYLSADVQTIATTLLRLAETAAEDDDRDEAREWATTFLTVAERNTVYVETLRTPAGKYEALSKLVNWRPPADVPPYAPRAESAIIVRDSETGMRIVRTSDVAAHVRGEMGRPIGWGTLHARLIEIGWEQTKGGAPGEFQQRQPGGSGILKARVYFIPGDWEA
jgi:hypothetical protein